MISRTFTPGIYGKKPFNICSLLLWSGETFETFLYVLVLVGRLKDALLASSTSVLLGIVNEFRCISLGKTY